MSMQTTDGPLNAIRGEAIESTAHRVSEADLDDRRRYFPKKTK